MARSGRLLGRRSPLRAILAVTAGPGAVTALALFPDAVSPTSAALLYVVAVIGAAIGAGVAAGLAASIVSFVALNFFFTPPIHTFSVGKVEDLVALVVFLAASATVGALVSRALEQRARAERREREARLLNQLGSSLLAGDPIGGVLDRVARGMESLFGLSHCRITTDPGAAETGDLQASGDRVEVIPMVARGRQAGAMVVDVGTSRPPLVGQERDVIRTFAGQIALALDNLEMAKEAESARVEADASRTRAALFSSISHDLRTPLASITAAVTSLLGNDARFEPGDRAELLETIRQEAERLNRLVGNFLHLSRIRAGGLEPAKTPAAVEEIVEGVVGRLEPALRGHPVRLLLREDLPEVPMDIIQMDQVLTNILENAAKYTPAGSEIAVQAARWQNAVQVRVIDRGPGISPEDRTKVFEPFYRAGGDTAPGTGLGLTIARAIVEAHGGRIWIEGTPGGGAAVVFELPVRGGT